MYQAPAPHAQQPDGFFVIQIGKEEESIIDHKPGPCTYTDIAMPFHGAIAQHQELTLVLVPSSCDIGCGTNSTN